MKQDEYSYGAMVTKQEFYPQGDHDITGNTIPQLLHKKEFSVLFDTHMKAYDIGLQRSLEK